MKQVINLYKKHQITVDMYLKNVVKGYKNNYIENAQNILKQNKFIYLIYAVDENYKQISPVICKKNQDISNVNGDKRHYFNKMVLDSDNIYISNPYIHYRTGKASLSIVLKKDDTYFVFDIGLIELLEELKLIEFNQLHDKFKRMIYFLGSAILTLVAIILLGYGFYIFASIVFFGVEINLLHDIFKSIIAVTLGLAIYDLAKQIFEHEVLFKTFHHSDDKEYKVLGKFLISIIIALSIETLLVVFKIALSDNPHNMLSAFYLISGVTMMVVGLGWFYKTIKSTEQNDEE